MHDILEGVAQWRLAEFFEYLTKNKILSQHQINSRVAAFNFGYMEKTNLPNSVTFEKLNVGLKAAQTWCLIRHIPLIFIDIFDSENPEWKERCNLIKILLKCMLCIFAPNISLDMIAILENDISQMLQSVRKVFPNKNLKPKEHFLIHYPRIMREMGPIVFLWCMRFEAKHLHFKKLAQSVQNFVNICKTFSLRHQEYVYHINSIPTEPITFKHYSGNEDFDFSCYHDLLANITEDLTFIKTISCTNYKFKKHLFIVTGIENDLPVFQEILAIYIHKDCAHFIADKWNTLKLNDDLIVYQIEKCDTSLSIIPFNKLYHPTPFDKLIVSNKHFIVTKYFVI